MSIPPAIPLPPPLLNLISSNQTIKKLRCLNLKALPYQSTEIPTEKLSSSIFSSVNSKDIAINEAELDEYFKISQVSKSKANSEASSKPRESSVSLYHLFENKNKYATSCISSFFITSVLVVIIKKYQLEVFFPLKIRDLLTSEAYSLTQNEAKFIDDYLFDYEFLVSLKVILPSKEEAKTILTQMSNMTEKDINSMAFIDTMYYTIAQFPEMNSFITGMISLIEMKKELEELTQSLIDITSFLESIALNQKLKYVIGLMLKINNYLSLSTGGRELKGFDLASLENVLDLKINSKCFFDLLGNYYVGRYNKESLFDASQLNALNFSLCYLSNEESHLKGNSLALRYDELLKGIQGIVCNAFIKEALNKELTGNMKEMIEKVDSLREKEVALKGKVSEYFLLEIKGTQEEVNADLIKIFKILLKIEGKLKCYLGLKNKANVNPEYNHETVNPKGRLRQFSLTEDMILRPTSKQYSDNCTYNKENNSFHNGESEESGFNSSTNKKKPVNVQCCNSKPVKQLPKHNFPISGTFIKKYGL